MAYLIQLVVAAIVVVVASSVAGKQIAVNGPHSRPVINYPPVVRVRRDAGYGPPVHTPKPYTQKYYTPGRFVPVFAFSKTDYHGNFKWGDRHRAGSQYAGSYH